MFIYDLSGERLPVDIEKNTGNGFKLINDKIITKYTYGVALLQLPFFLIADRISAFSDAVPRSGFSTYYQRSLNFASVFYLVFGLYLLFLSLERHFGYRHKTLWITIFIILFGTNLYYYGIIETGMSHVYSFFLFSATLHLLISMDRITNKYAFFALLAATSSLILLIRPINILFLTVIMLYVPGIKKYYLSGIKPFGYLKIIAICIALSLLIFLPQLIYWKYATGQYISYTYGDEKFSELLSPHLPEVLFAPNNGLFPYSIIFILILFGIIINIGRRSLIGSYSLAIFALLSYLTASWHDWKFGCGSGMRNMVEYFSLFSFPLCNTIEKIRTTANIYSRYSLWIMTFLMVIVSFKVNYHYFGCYFEDTWDWSTYINTLTYPISIH